MENNTKKKDLVKGKIILFGVGVVIGAVISTATFFVYTLTSETDNTSCMSSQQMRGGGMPPEMPNGESVPNGQSNTLPEKSSEQ